jgi:hypothetical protein
MKSKKKKILLIIIFVILIVLVILGALYYSKHKFQPNGKKINVKPIVEKQLTVFDEKSNKRPIAVMIDNNVDPDSHKGLQDAYLTYECIVEGGLTRIMAIFKDTNTSVIGPVRSSRHYFLDYAMENDAVYVHWGWSPMAESDIRSFGINNINGLSYEGTYFYRDRSLPVSLEHTGFTDTERIQKGIKNLGYRNTTGKDLLLNYSIDEIDNSTREGARVANNIDIRYSNIIETSYTYDSENKVYKRIVNDVPHKDYVTGKQYTFKNIITYQVDNYNLNDGSGKGRQGLENIGSGTGYYISNGYAIPITWEKKSRASQTIYKLKNGEKLVVNDGNTFIQIQPANQTLTIE